MGMARGECAALLWVVGLGCKQALVQRCGCNARSASRRAVNVLMDTDGGGLGCRQRLVQRERGSVHCREIYSMKVRISFALVAGRLACSAKEHCVCQCSPQLVRMELGCVWLLQLQASPLQDCCICKQYGHSYTLSHLQLYTLLHLHLGSIPFFTSVRCTLAASTHAWQWPNSKALTLTLCSATTQGLLARNPKHLEAEALRCPCAKRNTRSRYAQHPEDGHQLRVYIAAIVLYHARIVCAFHRACQQAYHARMEFCTAAPATRVV